MSPSGATTELPDRLTVDELRDTWSLLSPEDRLLAFKMVPYEDAEEFFLSLSARDQANLLEALPPTERRGWVRLLPPDDAADAVQETGPDLREELVHLLDDATRKEVVALLAYKEDQAGGLMDPRFARVRPDMSVDEGIGYLRKQAREYVGTLRYLYVLDDHQHLLGVVTLRGLFSSPPEKRVQDIMRTDVVTATADMDQEALSRLFAQHSLNAIPIVDGEGRMQGIVTVDDIVDVVQEEATEDIQKLGGMEALDAPYMQVGFLSMVRKRGSWLSALFLGEMLTATAMGYFQDEIARAVVLALFVPLIISSGGNSGSQATTLVIRAMALGEVTLRDWFRVIRRELMAGLALGTLLGTIGFLRIEIWQAFSPIYGPHAILIAWTVFVSLIGVVTFGTLAGSLLPFVLRRLRLDPASASAPFVATLVDVTGLVIYFTVASMVLRGRLL
ncbi:MAG: magnesium transporter [Candidatus Eisenbacteria bacterium]|uniref:Magnesium transporter MgtE n=1 Tax=Eiseniibacteriota bacterium TaxID=2212470 RepID=A0A9D6L3R0_UNCEI|nr:magnesium transporter [Candidatus Eisenbacteria bacterium]MBI3539232.1 magnesium transporter [Candidatus Eisenbacteria bacterium]